MSNRLDTIERNINTNYFDHQKVILELKAQLKTLMANVIKEDKRIVINKFVKGLIISLLVWGITALTNYVSGGSLPVAWGFWIPFILDILGTVKKALATYNPEYATEFEWFYTAIMRILTAIIDKLLKRNQ